MGEFKRHRYAINMAGKVRIISGRWRGRRLPVPDQPGLRPTSDRARETLFNWLAPYIRGARCLDLFAGSGALGLEAASRGASKVVLIERNAKLVQTLQALAASWPGGEVLRVMCADAPTWLDQAQGPFDLVFVDPPFNAGQFGIVLDRLTRPGLLADEARIYVESSARQPAPISAKPEPLASSPCTAAQFEVSPGWRLLREKRLGEVRLQLATPEPLPAEMKPDGSL